MHWFKLREMGKENARCSHKFQISENDIKISEDGNIIEINDYGLRVINSVMSSFAKRQKCPQNISIRIFMEDGLFVAQAFKNA